MNALKTECKEIFRDSARLKEKLAGDDIFLEELSRAASLLINCRDACGTITTCGNGGSACDAMHFAEELVARYKRERPGIKARHLMDAGVLTCWSNDYSFDTVFERQVRTLCEPNDVLVLFSTSGSSLNLIKAAVAARAMSVSTVGILGRDGGRLAALCDCSVIVPSDLTERIQEVHITVVHLFCELLETRNL